MNGIPPASMDGTMLVRGGRSTSASSAERSLLLGALATHMGALDGMENETQTIVRKSDLWDKITRHFNANTSTPRSRQQIQTLYKNMKAKARRYEARLAEVASGVPPPDPDPISEMLLGLLHQQMQHQRRHLQRLISGDTNGLFGNKDGFKMSQQYDSSVICPEQMLQVSLREGLTDEMDIKNEPREDELNSSGNLPDSDMATSELFNESVFTSPSSQPLSAPSQSLTPATSSPQQCMLSSESSPSNLQSNNLPLQSQTTVSPVVHSQSSTAVNFQNFSALFNQQPSSVPSNQAPQSVMNPSYTSPQTAFPVNSFPRLPLPSNEETSLNDMFLTPKRPRLENGATGLFGNMGCGGPPSRIPSLCCCPDIHSKLLKMAQEEHLFRMKLLREEEEMRAKEHAAKIRILSMEEEVVRYKLEEMRNHKNIEDTTSPWTPPNGDTVTDH